MTTVTASPTDRLADAIAEYQRSAAAIHDANDAVIAAQLRRRDAIAAAYFAGVTARQIADYTGLSVQRVQALLKPYRTGRIAEPPPLARGG